MPGPPEHTTSGVIEFGPFRLSTAERLIERSGEPLQLGGRAMDVLIALLERAGDVVSQRELIARVWPNITVEDSNLRFHIAALRRALGEGEDGARYVINVPGRGYCFVSPTMQSPIGGSTRTPDRQMTAVPVIPPRLRRMVGRDAVVDAIAGQLASQRFVTIVGPGGIGKTTVAVSVAHALATEYGAVCFADLGPLSDPRLLPSLIATALGLVARSDDPIPSLLGFLRDKRILLILDGCERVIEMAACLAEAIFVEAADVHILATSREALRIEGEHAYRLAPLECPPVNDTPKAAEVLAFPAAQLFADRVAAASDGFVIQDADAPVVARICHKLGGIALAIELAAGRVDAYGIEGVDALLDSKLSLLWQGRRTAPPRHQTLNAALDWSYDLLAESERAVLKRLVVFAGPFSLEGAQAVVRDDGAEADEVAEVIATLVAKSLIVSNTGAGKGVRFRLLDTTRTYLQTKLSGVAEANMIAGRHAAFFRTLLERVSAQTPAFAEARGFGAYAEHVGNVRAALEWSFSRGGDIGLGIALAAAAAPLFLELSLLAECGRWTEKALAAYAEIGENPRDEMELQASLSLSRLFTEGNSPAALHTLNRALTLAEEIDELGPQFRLIGSQHLFYTRIADFRGSVGLAERGLDVATRMGDPSALAVAEWMLGVSHHLVGDQTSAVIRCRSALPRPDVSTRLNAMRFGFDHRIRALCALSRALWLGGAVDEAVDLARHTISEAEALEHPVTLCISMIYTVFVFLWVGDWPEAEAIIERLISDTSKYSLAPYHAVALGLKGELTVRRGKAADAILLLRGCLQTMHSGRHEILASVFTSDLAEALAATGRLDEALATVSGALSEVEARGGSFDIPEMLRLKGNFLLNRDPSNIAEAEDCYRRSLQLANQQGALSWELRTATRLARLRAGQGRRAEANERLASMLGRFAQGKETIDLRAASDLLDHLA
jgi:predicted ATPase/DNA-binding winged helix-turn-helix (wHTH) protein